MNMLLCEYVTGEHSRVQNQHTTWVSCISTGSRKSTAVSGQSHAAAPSSCYTGESKVLHTRLSQSTKSEKQSACLTAPTAGAERGCSAAVLTCAPCRTLQWRYHVHGKLPNSPCHTLDGCCIHSAAAAVAAEAGWCLQAWMLT